jgi:hypothetical protein
MTFPILLVLLTWTILGFIAFCKFLNRNEKLLKQYSSGEVEAPLRDYLYASQMIFLGGPAIWFVCLCVTIHRLLKR